MLIYQPAKAEQYDRLFQLMYDQAPDYLEHTLELMEMTREEYSQLFQTVGQVVGIYDDGHVAGFYWVEERENTLHLHGLILKDAFQGLGIGSQVLRDIEARYSERVDYIELGVHQSNTGAIKLYKKFDYKTVDVLDDLGFEVMQKELQQS